MAAGAEFDITPYGTETMHVLRAEKGFIIAGQDTDGSMTPEDLGMQWCVGYDKAFSWIGQRALTREDTRKTARKQLVGLRPLNPKVIPQEGAQIIASNDRTIPVPMLGHVTSSYYSPSLDSGIALAVVHNGHQRMGETIWLTGSDGEIHQAEIVSTVFIDPKGERQNA